MISKGTKGDGRRRLVTNDYHPLPGVNQPVPLSELGSGQLLCAPSGLPRYPHFPIGDRPVLGARLAETQKQPGHCPKCGGLIVSMRILGYSKYWEKLDKPIHTTFRFPRKDTDWWLGEVVLEKVKPRTKGGGERIGIAKIINKEPRLIKDITEGEAIEDGFTNSIEMWQWLAKSHSLKGIGDLLINKLTLEHVKPKLA